MMKLFPGFAGAAVIGTILVGSAKADETAEQMIDEALQYMYHTCESLVRIADGDEDTMIDVLGKITSVSLYMRGIDIEEYELTEEQAETVRSDFLQSVSESCAEDPASLLAGVVDKAVKVALKL